MELSSSQIEEFEERGFLFFPELLKSHEVKLLTDHLEGLYSRTGPEVVREKKGDGIRLVYGTHEYCKPCLLYTSPSPRDLSTSRMPSSA